MRRDQLEHLIRASAAILGEREIIVIGNQSILGSFPELRLPAVTTASIEVDLVPLDDTDETKSTLVDGSIGELSPQMRSADPSAAKSPAGVPRPADGMWAQPAEVSRAESRRHSR